MSAALILGVHLAVIGFNLFGLVAVPIGAWRRWKFVHAPFWRLLHICSLAIVAVQAVLGRPCFLTIWQAASEGRGEPVPLIYGWVNSLVYWPLPMWMFTAAYVLLFAYALALLWAVPLRRR